MLDDDKTRAILEKKQELLRGGEACHAVRDFIAHFSNPLRLRILCELSLKSASVSELVEATGARQPTVSQQLNLLRLSGILTRTRDGNRRVYQIADPVAREMMEFIFSIADMLVARSRGFDQPPAGAC